ncbi:MAG: nuclear transport factor 2 family protein [Bradyrhizobium sp.]|nr:nuclear transport factor 2 family protein [Bradyrhizobium sp.]
MTAEDEIRAALSDYFDVVYWGDISKINKIYHPAARLYCASGDQFTTMSVEEYAKLVQGRESPAQKGEERQDVIEKIEMLAPTMARARVRERMHPKLFTDELIFLFVDKKWSIVAKAWHYDLAG